MTGFALVAAAVLDGLLPRPASVVPGNGPADPSALSNVRFEVADVGAPTAVRQ